MRIKVQGDLAMFSRGETRAEPYSYEVPPRTAIKGLLENIFWKPEMIYSVNKLVVCNEIKFVSIKRNNLMGKQSDKPIVLDQGDRTQRVYTYLKDVCYAIDFSIFLSAISDPEKVSVKKYYEQVERRLRKRQFFSQPYLGCRELFAHVSFLEKDDQVNPHPSLLGQEKDCGVLPKCLNWVSEPKGRFLAPVHFPYAEDGKRLRYNPCRVVPEYEQVILKDGVIQYQE
jgi:CRISPR-associated protein Cas5d